MLKHSLTASISALCGAIIGVLATVWLLQRSPAQQNHIKARSLTIVDERGSPAASLDASGGGAVLRFYDRNAHSVLEAGTARAGLDRFVRVLDGKGKILAALNSSPPYGETTLYLGDDRWTSRVIIGALPSDIDNESRGSDEWGVELRPPRSTQSLFAALVKASADGTEARAGILLIRSDGRPWSPK